MRRSTATLSKPTYGLIVIDDPTVDGRNLFLLDQFIKRRRMAATHEHQHDVIVKSDGSIGSPIRQWASRGTTRHQGGTRTTAFRVRDPRLYRRGVGRHARLERAERPVLFVGRAAAVSDRVARRAEPADSGLRNASGWPSHGRGPRVLQRGCRNDRRQPLVGLEHGQR